MNRVASRRPFLKVAGIAALIVWVIFITHLLFAPLGYLAVRSACAEEGGLRIAESVKVLGYWHAGYDWSVGVRAPDCEDCAEQVARREFEYVDFDRPKSSRGGPEDIFRYQLAPLGSLDCKNGASFSTPPSGQCVAATSRDQPPTDGYKYRSEMRLAKGMFGVPMRQRIRVVTEVKTGRVIATYKYFDYATPVEKQGRFEPSYHCVDPQGLRSDEDKFVSLVLRTAR